MLDTSPLEVALIEIRKVHSKTELRFRLGIKDKSSGALLQDQNELQRAAHFLFVLTVSLARGNKDSDVEGIVSLICHIYISGLLYKKFLICLYWRCNNGKGTN